MKKVIISFVASIVVFAVYLHLFRNDQLLVSLYLRDTQEVVQFIDTAYVQVLKSFEIVAANVIAALCGVAFARMISNVEFRIGKDKLAEAEQKEGEC